MRTLSEQLSQYARYHRDPRNILTHFAGIPLIVISVLVLLSFPLGGSAVTAAALVWAAANLYYLKLDLKFGLLMVLFTSLCWGLADVYRNWFAGAELVAGIALFVVGWVLQFIGHYYEGKKPAFVDDLIGLLIGPLFVVAEWVFLAGFAQALRQQIEQDAGVVKKQR